MKILHTSLFASLSLLAACAVGNKSTDPNAGVYDDYYSEAPSEDGTTADAGGGGERAVANSSETTSASTTSQAQIAKALNAKKPKVDGKKKKNKKKKRKKKKGKKFKVALDGAVPSSAPKGSLVEIYGSGFDQDGLMVAIGGKAQEIVETSEDRVVIKLTGGKGKLQVGKTPAKGKTFKAVDESEQPFVVIGKAIGSRTSVEQGLIANVYAIDGEVTELPTFEVGNEIGTVAVDNLDVNASNFKATIGGRKEWFGLHFRGSLNIPEAGSYTFCLNADDGAQLYLDGNVILDADGANAEATEVCETFDVDPGEYGVDLLKYQGAQGPFVLQLTWQKDGGEKVAIPAENFFPPEDAAELAR
ncbi:MAG: PA14 domain-containing protein [Myxococcota bacterium]